MPSTSTPLLSALTVWPSRLGRAPATRRAMAGWSADPVLGRFPTAALTAAAVSHPASGRAVLTALAARSDEPTAMTVALAGLAPTLGPIVRRWVRAGLSGADLEGAEADLIGECLVLLRCGRSGPVDPVAVVAVAWQRVCGHRRTRRARADREQLGSLESMAGRVGRSGVEEVLAELVDSVRSGLVSIEQARAVALQEAGWSSSELEAVSGVAAATERARRSRARRRLAGLPVGV